MRSAPTVDIDARNIAAVARCDRYSFFDLDLRLESREISEEKNRDDQEARKNPKYRPVGKPSVHGAPAVDKKGNIIELI